jgi:predicted secreted protein
MKKGHNAAARAVLTALLLAGPQLLAAGDIATFVNLGFSTSAEHFMFAQYGVHQDGSLPYAELRVVDVAANDFASGGVGSLAGSQRVDPGVTGEGALFSLLGRSVAVTSRYQIDHLQSGRLVYILLDGDEPLAEIAFRDFVVGRSYRVKLVQSRTGEGHTATSSFHIALTIDDATGTRNHIVGNPQIHRRGVLAYNIRQVLLAPDGDSLVFVVERHEANGDGVDVRYMVESIAL